MLTNYSRVRLLTNKFTSEGLHQGAIGYIIEIRDEDAYEVEFSDAHGATIAQVVVHESEIDVCEPN